MALYLIFLLGWAQLGKPSQPKPKYFYRKVAKYFQSGQAEGSCASGFGTCCVMRLITCGGVVTTNVTQLQNPSFPATYTAGGTCVYLVKRQTDNICQIRLDFDKFSLGYSSSSPTGCVTGTTDILSFSTPNKVDYPSVCGDISGQHSELFPSSAQSVVSHLSPSLPQCISMWAWRATLWS